MVSSNAQQDFAVHVVDLLQGLGPVTFRRMFGGHGIFLDGLMFGLIDGNTLYFKADSESKQAFVDLGLEPFTYIRQGQVLSLSYYQAPDEALEDIQEMLRWGNLGFACALRAVTRKQK